MTRYQHKPRQVILRFADMPGLEVVMGGMPVGKLMDMLGLADDFEAGKASAEDATRLFTMFAERLVSWNLDDENGRPVPADLAGVRSLDTDLFMAMFEGWFSGMTQVPKASSTPSSNGADLVASLPMETL